MMQSPAKRTQSFEFWGVRLGRKARAKAQESTSHNVAFLRSNHLLIGSFFELSGNHARIKRDVAAKVERAVDIRKVFPEFLPIRE